MTVMEWVEPFAFSVEVAFVKEKKNVLMIKVCIHWETLTGLDEDWVYWNVYLE